MGHVNEPVQLGSENFATSRLSGTDVSRRSEPVPSCYPSSNFRVAGDPTGTLKSRTGRSMSALAICTKPLARQDMAL